MNRRDADSSIDHHTAANEDSADLMEELGRQDIEIEDAIERSAASPPPKGSIGNPLTESDLPFAVPADGHYWIKLAGRDLTQLPFSSAGSVLAVEVRHA